MVLLRATSNSGGSMRAYSMDLRERILRDSDAGMKASAGHVPRQRLLGPAAHTPATSDRRSGSTPAAVRAAAGARPPAAHARGADPGATGPHPRRTAGGPRHVGQSDDHLAGREPAGLHPYKNRCARPNTTAPTLDPTHLVFLDESGVATNLLRRDGRGLRGQRVADHAPKVEGRAAPSSPRGG